MTGTGTSIDSGSTQYAWVDIGYRRFKLSAVGSTGVEEIVVVAERRLPQQDLRGDVVSERGPNRGEIR